MSSNLEAAREVMGFGIRRVAEALELDVSGYSRIERGQQQPKRDTARAIAAFFEVVPLGMVYDPTNEAYDNWHRKRDNRKALRKRAEQLTERFPELVDVDRRRRAKP